MFTALGTRSQYLHITHQSTKFLPNSKKTTNQSAAGLLAALMAQVLGETKAGACADPRERGGRCVAQILPHLLACREVSKAAQREMVSGPPVAIRQPCPHLPLSSVLVEGRRQEQDGAGCVWSMARASPS